MNAQVSRQSPSMEIEERHDGLLWVDKHVGAVGAGGRRPTAPVVLRSAGRWEAHTGASVVAGDVWGRRGAYQGGTPGVQSGRAGQDRRGDHGEQRVSYRDEPQRRRVERPTGGAGGDQRDRRQSAVGGGAARGGSTDSGRAAGVAQNDGEVFGHVSFGVGGGLADARDRPAALALLPGARACAHRRRGGARVAVGDATRAPSRSGCAGSVSAQSGGGKRAQPATCAALAGGEPPLGVPVSRVPRGIAPRLAGRAVGAAAAFTAPPGAAALRLGCILPTPAMHRQQGHSASGSVRCQSHGHDTSARRRGHRHGGGCVVKCGRSPQEEDERGASPDSQSPLNTPHRACCSSSGCRWRCLAR
eukprot:ctg_335.g121